MAKLANVDKIPLGQADIKIADAAVEALADSVTLVIETTLGDVTQRYEYGDDPIDKYVTGHNITVEMVFAEESMAVLKEAMIAHFTTTGTGETAKTTIQDAPVGKTLTELGFGKEILIHRRKYGANTDNDVTIYKAVPTSGLNVVYGPDQSNISVTFQALPKDGADPSKEGNFFRIGPAIAP